MRIDRRATRLLHKRNRRGNALVEMALCSSIFLMVFFGVFELSRAVWVYNTVAHAARQGARYAAVHGETDPVTNEQILAKVKSQAPGLDPDLIQLTTTWTPDRSFGSLVQVEFRYDMPLIVSPLVLKSTSISMGATGNSIVTN